MESGVGGFNLRGVNVSRLLARRVIAEATVPGPKLARRWRAEVVWRFAPRGGRSLAVKRAGVAARRESEERTSARDCGGGGRPRSTSRLVVHAPSRPLSLVAEEALREPAAASGRRHDRAGRAPAQRRLRASWGRLEASGTLGK